MRGRGEVAVPVPWRVLGGQLVGRVAGPVAVAVDGQAVHGQGVGDEDEVLALMADRVSSPEEEGVLEGSVDRFGVVASAVEPLEVDVAGGDGADVLGAIELASGVLGVAVEPDRDRSAAEGFGEFVVVVPAVLALVGVAVGADPSQRREDGVAGGGDGADADGTALGEQRDGRGRAAGEGDLAVFEAQGLLGYSPFGPGVELLEAVREGVGPSEIDDRDRCGHPGGGAVPELPAEVVAPTTAGAVAE